MTLPRSITAHHWILALLAALFLLFWTAHQRVDRLETVSRLGLAQTSGDGLRTLLVPLHAQGSYEWIAQAGQAQNEGGWRVRHVTYDNAVAGRTTHLAAPYRLWVQTVAWFDGFLHNRPADASLERAALWAGPALQALLLLVLVPWVARSLGAWSAGLVALGWVALYPLNTLFLPGQPDDLGLKAAVVFAHAVCLVRGVHLAAGAPARARRWFLAAGALGGFGCWLHIASQLPLIAGVLAAAALVRWRRPGSWPALPWRSWATAGAVVSVFGWLFEYAPAHLTSPRLEVNHPLYAFAWLGAAHLLARDGPLRRGWMWSLFSVAAVAAPFATAWLTGSSGFPGAAANVSQVSGLNSGLSAGHLGAWLARDGFSLPALATLVAVLLALAAAALLWSGRLVNETRQAVLLLLGPVVLWTVLASFRLYAWTLVDAVVLALLAAVAPALAAGRPRGLGAVMAGLAFLPGLWLSWPRGGADGEVSAVEVEALIARDLAHTLTRRAGAPGAVVLAPPNLTAALAYFGNLRGVGTTYWENRDGLAASVRLMGATSTDEALALAERREIRYVVLPSWDSTLEDLARLAAGDFDRTLAGLLRQWLPPRWLRPVPYALPGIAGLETRAVMMFEVVEAQDNATALARLAEYFLEMGQAQLAVSVAGALRQSFPTELSALAGRLYVEMAQRDTAAVNATLATIHAQLAIQADEILPWERRVSLAVALAQARQLPAARPLLEFSLATVDEDHLRSLTTGTLYRLLAVARAADLAWPEEDLRQTALALLPPEWRDRL